MGLLEDIKNRKIAKENLVKDLKNAKTLNEFFTMCNTHFDCESTNLNIIAKTALISNIDKLIDISGVKTRK